MADEVELVLLLDGPEGAPVEAWRLVLPPATVHEGHDALVADFRAMSGAHGMAMEPREIRKLCWAPLAAKLAGLMGCYTNGADTTTARFAERALCYLAQAAIGILSAGDRVAVAIDASGEVTVERTPHRLLHRNHAVLGNHRREMERAALARTQGP